MTPHDIAVLIVLLKVLLTIATIGLASSRRHKCTWDEALARKWSLWALGGILWVFVLPVFIFWIVIYFPCVYLLTMALCRLADLKKAAVDKAKSAGVP
jgi:hypothetical protein